MALDAAQEARLALMNELITTDPATAHALAERFARAGTAGDGRRGPQLSPEERAAAEQLARNTCQPVQVVDVKAEEKFYGGRYSGELTLQERQTYGERVASGHSPAEADYSIWLDRGPGEAGGRDQGAGDQPTAPDRHGREGRRTVKGERARSS